LSSFLGVGLLFTIGVKIRGCRPHWEVSCDWVCTSRPGKLKKFQHLV